jgi:hypothetical protein
MRKKLKTQGKKKKLKTASEKEKETPFFIFGEEEATPKKGEKAPFKIFKSNVV